MKRLKNVLGIALMVMGTALLAVLHIFHLTFLNPLLLLPLALILLGLVLHVRALKRQNG